MLRHTLSDVLDKVDVKFVIRKYADFQGQSCLRSRFSLTYTVSILPSCGSYPFVFHALNQCIDVSRHLCKPPSLSWASRLELEKTKRYR